MSDAGFSPAAFLSDNASPAHPAVLDAVRRANEGPAAAYGADPSTAAAEDGLRELFGDVAVRFVYGGTGGNYLALRTVCDRFGAVLCAESSHLANDECGGPEQVGGVKLVTVPGRRGKLDPAAIEERLPEPAGPHRAPARALSITQPTELGTLYTLDELDALGELAQRRDLRLHLDGARLPLAAAALGCELGDLVRHADVVCLGGTKLGLLGAEAVIFRDRELAADAAFHQKQIGQLASKQRFLAAQTHALFAGDLWRRLAQRCLASARRLAAVVDARPELEIAYPVETNAVFARAGEDVYDGILERAPGSAWSRRRGLIRWMTGWSTTAEDLDAFAAALGE